MSFIHPLWRWLTVEIEKISSLSGSDYVCLVANYNTLVSGEKGRVSSAIRNRGYSEKAIAEIEREMVQRFRPVTSCGLRFTKPFAHLKYEPIHYVLTLFENYQKGLLPFEGSVADQPAQIMEVFSVLALLQKEQEEINQKKLNSNGRNQYKNIPRTRR